MQEFALRPSSTWGATWKAGRLGYLRALKKRNFFEQFAYPFLDHSAVFAWKQRGRRGPAREKETLIVAYPYKDAVDRCSMHDTFISTAQEIGLRVVEEEVIYRGHPAYRILVADHDVDIEAAIMQLPAVS